MRLVKTSCSYCGSVQLPASDVWLELGKKSYYLFTCPDCKMGNRKKASPTIVAMLQGAGVRDIEAIVAEEMANVGREE